MKGKRFRRGGEPPPPAPGRKGRQEPQRREKVRGRHREGIEEAGGTPGREKRSNEQGRWFVRRKRQYPTSGRRSHCNRRERLRV